MGYAKAEPVADNRTAAGRAQNRRVEVKLLLNRGLNQQSQTKVKQ
jgi:flagellar motor protein MotB